jgi:hypothetical protein
MLYLRKMDEGHVGKIYVLNANGDQLGQDDFSAESPDFEVRLPAIAGAPAKPPAAVDTAPTPSTGEAPSSTHWGLWAMFGGSILVIALVAWRGIARQNVERKTSP